MRVSPPFPKFEVTGLNSACAVFGVRSGGGGGGGDWMAVAGELTSNMKVKWQAGHNKVSLGVPPFQTSQEQSGRKRPSQLLTDVPGRMFHWRTGGRHHSLMVPLITSNLHLAGSYNTQATVWDPKHPSSLTLVFCGLFSSICCELTCLSRLRLRTMMFGSIYNIFFTIFPFVKKKKKFFFFFMLAGLFFSPYHVCSTSFTPGSCF